MTQPRAARALTAGLIIIASAGLILSTEADWAAAQSGPTTTLEDDLEGNLGRIIPRPNSGREPERPGDRGGWLQLTILGVMTAGLVVIGTLVVRESRRSRAGPTV